MGKDAHAEILPETLVCPPASNDSRLPVKQHWSCVVPVADDPA